MNPADSSAAQSRDIEGGACRSRTDWRSGHGAILNRRGRKILPAAVLFRCFLPLTCALIIAPGLIAGPPNTEEVVTARQTGTMRTKEGDVRFQKATQGET